MPVNGQQLQRHAIIIFITSGAAISLAAAAAVV